MATGINSILVMTGLLNSIILAESDGGWGDYIKCLA